MRCRGFHDDGKEWRPEAAGGKAAGIRDIRMRALYIERQFRTNRPDAMEVAERDQESLQDRFCEENRDFITPPTARALKRNFETFMTLVDWADRHDREKEA